MKGTQNGRRYLQHIHLTKDAHLKSPLIMDKQTVVYVSNGYYSSMERNKLLTYTITSLNMKYSLLSEKTLTQKNTYYMITVI